GWDEDPHDSGELCVVEVFGSAVEPGRSAEVGMGIKALRDPRLRDDVAAPRLPIDVADWHTYRVDWDDAEARFAVDGVTLRTCPRPPRYPLVLMIGVFDFPDGTETAHTPALEISRAAGTATREGQGSPANGSAFGDRSETSSTFLPAHGASRGIPFPPESDRRSSPQAERP